MVRTYLNPENFVIPYWVSRGKPGTQHTDGELVPHFWVKCMSNDWGHDILVQGRATVEVVDCEQAR